PGGKFNDPYTAYLDLIVDYAKGLDDEPILFRPLHENTGSWFWWGAAFCSPETYKSVFKYTVDYIREQGVHNLLYLYGPGSEAGSVEEYAERYPGDNYVDMVGFDSYDSNPKADDSYTFQQTLENTIKITSQFAKEHNKLFAVTETGIAHDEKEFNGQKALLLTNNERKEWYTEILDLVTKPGYNCCYFMLWSNYDTKSFYTPFVASKKGENVLLGHELIDYFLKFYRDKRSIFAADQQEIVHNFSDITVPGTSDNELDGYMTYPIANSRILDAATFKARFNKELSDSQSVIIRMSGNGKEISINGVKDSSNGKIYNAELKAEDLKSLGEVLDGTISLYVDGKCYQTIDVIFNVEERKMLPEQVDDFESYSGLVNLLIGKWSAGKDSSSKIDLSLAKDPCYEGDYALKLAFTLAKNGYVGAEFSKEADWSSYNALRFWVKPDGKNQKTVVQIKADGKGYEAYLNIYPDYANAKTPLLVTLPFSEFISNKGEPLTAATLKNMSNFSFWVNAIPESDVFKDSEEVYGELYYDDIRAVSAETDKPVFEAAEGKKPSEGTYTVKFDTSKVSNAMVAAKKNSEVFKTGGSVNAKDQLQFEITPADGYSVTSADVSVAGGTCKVSEAEKTANGVYIITLSEFTANTEATVNVKTEKAEVRENGTKAEENFGEANLSKTEFKDIQEDIKNNVKDALEKLVNSAPAGQEKEKAQEAIKAIENNEAFIDISLQVAKKTDDITEDEKTQNDIKVEDIRKEVQKNNSNADVEVKTAVTLDISLFSVCKYTKNNEEIAKAAVKELTKPVKISMKLPDNIPAVKEGAKRIYYIICLHKNNDGKIEPSHVTCDYDENKGIISFDGSRFSTYVLCYADIVSKSASGSHTIGGGTAVILGSVTSTATPVPTAVPGTTPDTAASAAPTATAAPGSKPGTVASAAPITTPVPAVTPSPDAVPSATGTPSATAKPSNTPAPSDKPGTPTSKVKKGTKFITKGTTYKVTSVSGTKTVTCIKFKKDIKKAVVPAAIKI
ncbi:MAG TPA: hypothetical protein DCZ23_07880, partial [Lachnospiraceae bacterium]|nr:hypothetical protein [Lachnospiraceae bacterium]